MTFVIHDILLWLPKFLFFSVNTLSVCVCVCDSQTQCRRLWCTSPEGAQRGCRTQHMPWADGTDCSPGKVSVSVMEIKTDAWADRLFYGAGGSRVKTKDISLVWVSCVGYISVVWVRTLHGISLFSSIPFSFNTHMVSCHDLTVLTAKMTHAPVKLIPGV